LENGKKDKLKERDHSVSKSFQAMDLWKIIGEKRSECQKQTLGPMETYQGVTVLPAPQALTCDQALSGFRPGPFYCP
jgi:hypothetical protein